jgi:hypothetical protein
LQAEENLHPHRKKYLASQTSANLVLARTMFSGTAVIARGTPDQIATLSRDPLRHRAIRIDERVGTSFRSALRSGGGRSQKLPLEQKKQK